MPRSIDLFCAAVLLALILTPQLWPERTLDLRDTLSNEPSGKSAFFQAIRRLYPATERKLTGTLIPDEQTHTLVLMAPARTPLDHELAALFDWVGAGGVLVWIARHDAALAELDRFGVYLEPATISGTSTGPYHVGSIPWSSEAAIRVEQDSHRSVLKVGSEDQIVELKIGDGMLAVAASDELFSNHSLALLNHGILAVRVLESAMAGTSRSTGTIVFDETLSGSGAPKIVGLLFDSPFRVLSFQILILVWLFLWVGLRRFGSAWPGESGDQLSFTEHARALGNLHFRSGDGRPALRAYWEYCRSRLGRHVLDPTLALARGQANTPGETHEADLEVARQVRDWVALAEAQTVLPPSRAARGITQLARLLHARRSPKET